MNVLVTGGAGFIGSHLTETLAAQGHEVVVLDNLSEGNAAHLPKGSRLIEVDVQDGECVRQALSQERPECVVHLAAQANVRRSITAPGVDAQVNILGTINILEASVLSGARRVILASSGGAIYGEQEAYPCREECVPQPSSPYGVAKLAGEHYGRALARRSGIQVTALRLANVYGPRQNPLGEAGIVSLFLDALGKGEPAKIFGDGLQTRDFIWVGDVVRAFEAALTGPPGTYNIGTGREVGVLELWGALETITGFSSGLRYLPPIPGEVRRNVLAIDQASRGLGWIPQVGLEEGLRRTVKECLSGRQRPGVFLPDSR